MVPLSSPSQIAEGNMANLSPTIPINISCVPGNIENVYVGADFSSMRLESTPRFLNNFEMCSLGRMRRCRELTFTL